MLTRTQEVNTKIWSTITKLRSERNNKLPTEEELCNMFSVSRSTIRRATKDLVDNGTLKRVQGKGTFISEQRSSDVASTGKIPLVGLACDTLQFSDYMVHIIKGIVKAAHEKGLEVMVCSFGGNSMVNSWLPTQQGPAQFVGFISPEFSRQTIDLLEKRNVPYVALMETRFLEDAKYAVFSLDDLEKCVEYLFNLGHTRICYVEANYNLFNLDNLKRISQKYSQKGKSVTLTIKEGNYLPDKTREVIDEVLAISEENRPTAFICNDDIVASWVINHLKRKNFSVPQDFSVIGIGNLSVGTCSDPQITTASVSYDELGAEAVDLFIKQLNREAIDNPTRRLFHHIIERESCDRPRSLQ